MKHTLPIILLSCLLISGLAVAKDVPRDLQAVPGGPIISGDSAKQTCQIGNYNFDGIFFWLGANYLWGNESYKLIVGPEDLCPNCAEGLTVETVTMVIIFGDEDVPSEFTVSADIEEAVWDGECWAPGPQVALSDPVTFTIDVAGVHALEIPIVTPCLERGFNYGIGVNFLTAFPEAMRPDYTFDVDQPTFCTSWGLWEGATEWERILEIMDVSDLLIWADADCCENPVGAESRSFGEVKSLFR